MKTIRMATALLYPLAPCRAHGGRATVQGRYTAILYPLQSLSLRISNEAATPNELERGLLHFFSSGDSHRMDGVRRGVSPSPAAGYDAERIYHAYAGLRELGTASDTHLIRSQEKRILCRFF